MFNNYNYFPFGMQPRFSLFRGLRGLSLGDILAGTQRTLNVVNQAIPIFYQIRPLWNNTKTIFKIANAINEDNTTKTQKTNNVITKEVTKEEVKPNVKYNQPVFFL